jgi:hypothetical protein
MNVQLSVGTEGLARAAALEAIADRLSRFLRVLDAEARAAFELEHLGSGNEYRSALEDLRERLHGISKQLHSPDSSPVSHGESSPLGDGIINGRRVSERAWREYLARGCDLWATPPSISMDEPDSPELL